MRAKECRSPRSLGKSKDCYNFEVVGGNSGSDVLIWNFSHYLKFMRNLEISFIFNQIADLLEIQGANPFRIRAYRRAALNIEGLADNIETLSLQGSLRNVPGIGEDLANKIDEYLRASKIAFHEELKKEVPPGLARMVEIPSVGPKTAKEIYDRFRIEAIEDLEALCKTDKLLGVPGFKKQTIENMLRGIDLYRKRKGNYLLGRTVPIA